MVLPVVVAVVILMLTAAVKGDDSGQQGERHEEVKNIEAVSSCTQTADTLTGAAVPEQEKEFEEWVKPHIEGMVPVYGRAGIDYISLDDFELSGHGGGGHQAGRGVFLMGEWFGRGCTA